MSPKTNYVAATRSNSILNQLPRRTGLKESLTAVESPTQRLSRLDCFETSPNIESN